jgi:hypothetical protein
MRFQSPDTKIGGLEPLMAEGESMGAFISLYDFTTAAECLERKLFGTNPGEMHQHHYSKIGVGDILFLYNFETGQTRGPFTPRPFAS